MLAQKVAMVNVDRIEISPKVMLGKPVIRGTRVTVELILRKLGEGASESDLLDAYPRLTAEDIRAAMRYAADVVAHEEIAIVPAGPAASAVMPVSGKKCSHLPPRRRARPSGPAAQTILPSE